jgi:hypothetical protein
MLTTLCTVFWIINQYFFYRIFKKYFEKQNNNEMVFRCILENIESKKIAHQEKLNLDLKNEDTENCSISK